MCGHGVPHAALLELGDAHLQLTGVHAGNAVDKHLVYHAVVAFLQRTCLDVVGLGQGYLLNGVGLVGGCRVKVELGGLGGVLAAHGDVLAAASHVECFLEAQVVALAVDGYGAVATDVDDAELAVVQQVLPLVPLLASTYSGAIEVSFSGVAVGSAPPIRKRSKRV